MNAAHCLNIVRGLPFGQLRAHVAAACWWACLGAVHHAHHPAVLALGEERRAYSREAKTDALALEMELARCGWRGRQLREAVQAATAQRAGQLPARRVWR